ncbi:protein transport protein Sec24C isoform X2 [Hypomesus transpacificus]|uniref:protein transport protein Sec24C isoform X2 n=1 Tax=Hypomesus transpacificus TaxID=137520 RepID=UPI001F0779D8|nr:protein transport protein Sec24C isoform X2 [Hypomesus transpacificus]
MDTSPSNHTLTSGQLWPCQNGWSVAPPQTGSPPKPACPPLPNLQYLTLGSTTAQGPGGNNLQRPILESQDQDCGGTFPLLSSQSQGSLSIHPPTDPHCKHRPSHTPSLQPHHNNILQSLPLEVPCSNLATHHPPPTTLALPNRGPPSSSGPKSLRGPPPLRVASSHGTTNARQSYQADGEDPSHPPDMGHSPTQGSWSTRPIQRCPPPPVWSQSPSSPVQPGWSPSSPVQPAWSPSSPVQPAWSPSSPVQPAWSPSCPVQPGWSPSSPVQPAWSPSSPVQPAWSPSSPVQPAWSPSCPVQPGWSPSSSVQPAWSPSCPVQPGWSPSSPVQQQPLLASPQQPYTGAGYTADTASHPCREQSLQEASTHLPCLSPGETGATSSPSSESRYGLQPQLLPSAVKVMEDDRAEWEGRVFVSELGSSLPPLATTECITEDRGNARPGYMRATSYCVPCEGPMALLSHLPLGALVTPLALPGPQERPLPVSSEGECVRGCGACGAYMCPAVTWQDCGQRFYCPFCGKLNEVSWQHYQPTRGTEGVRMDRETRPELSLGSYEVVRNQQEQPAVLLLAVDVSPPALRGGHLDLVCRELQALLSSLNKEEGAVQSGVRVGLMTYDSRIHLYDLSPALSRPHMLVVTETEDFQLPVREGLLVPLRDCVDSIDSVLQLIPQFSAECNDSSGAPMELPVKAGLAILQALGSVGKLLVFHSAPLMEGAHTQTSGFFSSNKSKSLFQPLDSDVSLAKKCVNQGCGLHLFAFCQQDVGGAWPGHVPYLTGGALRSYDNLLGELERERFGRDLRMSVETETGYRAQIKIFVSKDMRVSGCYGSFVPGPSPSNVTLASLDWRTTLAIELSHSRALEEKRGVVIQVVLSYTSERGERRTRVHTLTLRCSRHLLDTFRHCQAQTLLTFYCKKMYCSALERPLQDLREELQTEVTEALACYRKHCSSTSVSPGQLVLPQHLRVLPVYINSLRKSEVLLPAQRCSVHTRLALRSQLVAMDTASTARHFYPLLLPLTGCDDMAGDASGPSLGPALRCSGASLEPGGLYLASSPLSLLIWVGHTVPSHTLELLFNTRCLASLPSGETKLPVLDNPLSISVRSLLQTLGSQGPTALKVSSPEGESQAWEGPSGLSGNRTLLLSLLAVSIYVSLSLSLSVCLSHSRSVSLSFSLSLCLSISLCLYLVDMTAK